MKKIIILVIVLITADTVFSQQANFFPTFSNQDYLQKSKKQKKTARIMLGGGATLVLTGIIIPKGEVINYDPWVPNYQKEYKNDGIKGAFYFIGTLSMLGSMPFFITSHHNKKMAASLSFKNEMAPQILNNCFVSKTVPSLSIKFAL